MAHIGADEFGLRTQATKLGGKGVAHFFTAAAHDQAGAIGGEGEGGSAANAGEGAGNQDDGGIHGWTPWLGGGSVDGQTLIHSVRCH